jgi:hypothetical protein
VCIALCVLAGVFVVIGVMYFFVPAADMPSVLRVKPHVGLFKRYKVHHVSHPVRKRAVIAFGLASLPLIGAWWLRYRYDPPD